MRFFNLLRRQEEPISREQILCKIQLSSAAIIMPLTDEQKAEFKQLFDAVDANGSGTVDASVTKPQK